MNGWLCGVFVTEEDEQSTKHIQILNLIMGTDHIS